MSTQPTLLHLPAPAKLNLFLHVLGQREDGYHLLQSVFMLIDWQDSLDFVRTNDGHISRTDTNSSPNTPVLPTNDLCTRAAHLLQQASHSPYGVHISLHKNIPSQAGMGGGSSDAATTLLALNHLWGLNYTLQELIVFGLQLGADVPFFLAGHNAWVQGIGEQLQAIDIPVSRWLVIKPEGNVSTPEIFSSPDLSRNTEAVSVSDFAADPLSFGHNDLQAVAIRLCPSIAHALNWMEQHGLQGRMTGSGSAVFARLPPEANVQVLQKNIPKNWIFKICSNLSADPLLQLRASKVHTM